MASRLVVDVAFGVPNVVPEETRDERRAANLVQNIAVYEPLLERLPVHDGCRAMVPDIESTRYFAAVTSRRQAVSISVRVPVCINTTTCGAKACDRHVGSPPGTAWVPWGHVGYPLGLLGYPGDILGTPGTCWVPTPGTAPASGTGRCIEWAVRCRTSASTCQRDPARPPASRPASERAHGVHRMARVAWGKSGGRVRTLGGLSSGGAECRSDVPGPSAGKLEVPRRVRRIL